MRAIGIAAGFLTLIVPAGVSAQVTISDGVARPSRWAYCETRPSERLDRNWPYVATPVFARSMESLSAMTGAILHFWTNEAPAAEGYVQYSTVSCLDWFTTRAEAEASRTGARARFPAFREVGAAQQQAIAAQAAAAAEAAAVRAATDVEVQRLGEHRRAEAERLVRMRRAAERARGVRGCPLGPNAPVTCE